MTTINGGQPIPASYGSISHLPDVIGEIDSQSPCARTDGDLKVAEVLCWLDQFSSGGSVVITGEDMEAAAHHSGVSLFLGMTQQQRIELVTYFSRAFRNFPPIQINTKDSTNVVHLSFQGTPPSPPLDEETGLEGIAQRVYEETLNKTGGLIESLFKDNDLADYFRVACMSAQEAGEDPRLVIDQILQGVSKSIGVDYTTLHFTYHMTLAGDDGSLCLPE